MEQLGIRLEEMISACCVSVEGRVNVYKTVNWVDRICNVVRSRDILGSSHQEGLEQYRLKQENIKKGFYGCAYN